MADNIIDNYIKYTDFEITEMFGRFKAKIVGLLEAGEMSSKFVFVNNDINFIVNLPNYRIRNFDKNSCMVFRGGFYKHDENNEIIPLFNTNGELKTELFGTIKVKIIEIHKGFKRNTVFYGILKKQRGDEIIVLYGFFDRKKKNIQVGEILDISPLEIIESNEYNKNEKLLENYRMKREI